MREYFRLPKVPGPTIPEQLGKSCRIVKDREKAECLCGQTSAQGFTSSECFPGDRLRR
jgi:hypothetical protein